MTYSGDVEDFGAAVQCGAIVPLDIVVCTQVNFAWLAFISTACTKVLNLFVGVLVFLGAGALDAPQKGS